MRITTCVVLGLTVLLAATNGVSAQDHHSRSTDSRIQHFEGVNQRGDMAMGFDHSKTTHHFRLYKDGGAIGVETNDAQDTQDRDAIRRHLRQIRQMFADGNFELPMFIHATTPPGMNTLRRLRKQINYIYEDTSQGAQVRLRTRNLQAVAAIHKFLRFQIRDHRTGDATAVQK